MTTQEWLSLFFDENGLIGGIEEIFEQRLEEIRDYTQQTLERMFGCHERVWIQKSDPNGDEWYIEHAKTMVLKIMCQSKVLCELPQMSRFGYFIISGFKKAPSILELSMSDDTVVSLSNEPHSGPEISCRVKFPGSSVFTYVDLRSDGLFYLKRTSGDSEEKGKVILLFGYLEEKFPQKWRETVRLFNDPELNVMVACCEPVTPVSLPWPEHELFPGRQDREILLTLCHMALKCSKRFLDRSTPCRDDYRYKQLRTPGDSLSIVYISCVRHALGKLGPNKFGPSKFGPNKFGPNKFGSNKFGSNFSRFVRLLRESVDTRIFATYRTGSVKLFGRIYPRMVMPVSERSHVDILSSIRKTVVPCDENTSEMGPRLIHSSQYGFVCPCETPEGMTVGLIRRLAVGCIVSPFTDFKEVSSWLMNQCLGGTHLVSLNGVLLDAFCESSEAVSKIKEVFPKVSVWHDPYENGNVISVRCCYGRLLRRVMSEKTQKEEWIDSSEQQTEWNRRRYKDIDPSLSLGLSASLIPLANHNQAARSVFGASMVKQSIIPVQIQTNEESHQQVYCQVPLVRTSVGVATGMDISGVNLVMAILSLTGYGQEDGIILKRSSVERGLFSSVTRKTLSKSQSLTSGDREVVRLGQDYYGVSVPKGSRTCEKFFSTASEITEEMVNESTVRVTTEKFHTTHVGDKISSRHAQKGVICRLLEDVDMPYTEDGVLPDLILNPHSIPSRMTMGHLLEGVMGIQCSVDGQFSDGTSFADTTLISESIQKLSPTGNSCQLLMSGTIGEPMGYAQMGVIYYSPLVHQAEKKVYTRWSGPRGTFTRQPLPGKSKEGGLRIGEMELDCLIAHGAHSLIQGISSESDLTSVALCRACGTMVTESLCPYCQGNLVDIVTMPYSFVLFRHIMACNHVAVRMPRKISN